LRAPQTGEPGRGSGASGGRVPVPAITPALVAVLLAGLALRVIIAYGLFPGAGFKVDIDSFSSWALTLAEHGPDGFYRNAGFADYTPGYLYPLWLVGLAARFLGDLTGAGAGAYVGSLIKVPAIVFDLILACVLYRTARGWSGERAGLAAAALYLFIPITWYESALWGQVDAVGALVLLGAVLLLIRGWSEPAVAAAVLAPIIKPQYGIVLLVVGIVLLRRHLLRPGSGPVPEPRGALAWLDGRLGGWFTTEQGPWRLVSSAAVGLLVAFATITPFDLAELAVARAPGFPIGGDLGGLLVLVGSTAGEYHYLTVNAYNLWALVGPTSLAHAGVWTSDLGLAFGAVPFVAVGTGLLLAGLAFIAWQLLRRDDRTSIVVATTVLALGLFVLPTRVHERYLFPVFAVGALLAAGSVAWRRWYVLLGLVNLVNLHAVLTRPQEGYGTPQLRGLLFAEETRTEAAVVIVAIAHTALFAWALWQLRPAVDDLLGLLGRAPRPAPEPEIEPVRRVWRTPWSRPPAGAPGGPTVPLERAAAPTLVPAPAVTEAPEIAGPATGAVALGSLRRRLSRPAVRADRSRLLGAEGSGRLDRLDALVVALLIVAALTLRTFRLDQPYGMHFDEVYHARTATEFLQDWRYGMPHDIYEYTHPHLAKYLIAAGIVLFGDDRVTGESSLGTPVRDVAVEPRYADPLEPQRRAGDRLFVATGSAVRVLDLLSREDESRLSVNGASAVAVDSSAHRLYVGTDTGLVWQLETGRLDLLRSVGGEPQAAQPVEVGRVEGPVQRLWVAGRRVVLRGAGDRLSSLDPETGEVTGTATVPGLAAAIPLSGVSSLVAHPAQVTDPEAAGARLGDVLGVSGASLAARLRAGGDELRLASYLTAEQRSELQAAIDAGDLPGIEVTDREALAVAAGSGLSILDAVSLETIDQEPLTAAATGLDRVGGLDRPTLYVATEGARIETFQLGDDGPPRPGSGFAMPGPVGEVRWNAATNLVHVLGETPDGRSTIYVVEPHANAVFADAALPFRPAVLVLDAARDTPALDREEALVFEAGGRVAAVDTGGNAFAWRFPGVVAGVLLAAALYLLARRLFRRRAVGLLVAVVALLDGMLFATSRIAMNDTYVGLFIVAAYLALAWLLIDPPAGRTGRLAVLLGLPAIGGLLGLALAAKWVGAYAIGGAVLIVLFRSSAGRLLALAGMVVLTGVLGYLAVVQTPPNLFFFGLMVGLTALLAAGIVLRPVAGRVEPRWADPVRLGGAPFLLALLALTALPLAVYVLSYVPWAMPWHAGGPQIVPGWPPGHEGQLFVDLQGGMYDYHDHLRATHPASSPWWAWPFDLKPVWFSSQAYGGGTQGYIFDMGNLVLFWLAVPAAAFGAWQAWGRRSAALGFVVLAFLSQWLPWARIDRATFQYHWYTALPFALLLLAYFLAELWHGPSRRTWQFARAVAAVTIMAPGLLWLLKDPLCAAAGVGQVNPGAYLCTGSGSLDPGSTRALITTAVVLVVGYLALAGALGWLVLGARDPRRYVMVALAAAALYFLAVYPNISGLPLPADPEAYSYQRLLPTWDYSFQFAVNTAPANATSILGPWPLLFVAGTGFFAAATGYAVWARRTGAPGDGASDALGAGVDRA